MREGDWQRKEIHGLGLAGPREWVASLTGSPELSSWSCCGLRPYDTGRRTLRLAWCDLGRAQRA